MPASSEPCMGLTSSVKSTGSGYYIECCGSEVKRESIAVQGVAPARIQQEEVIPGYTWRLMGLSSYL